MRTIVTTALSGELLRNYAAAMKCSPRFIAFPEAGLSPVEQAAFMKQSASLYDEIVTFSSFIISDAEVDCVKVLDSNGESIDIKHGDSVNRITMKLGQRDTIGNMAAGKIASARAAVDGATSAEEIGNVMRDAERSLGDSIEKMFFVSSALAKIDSLNGLTNTSDARCPTE